MNDTLYQRLMDAGCEIENRESDLWVKYTPKAQEVIAAYRKDHPDHVLPLSWGRGDGDSVPWVEIAFAYVPFWEKKND